MISDIEYLINNNLKDINATELKALLAVYNMLQTGVLLDEMTMYHINVVLEKYGAKYHFMSKYQKFQNNICQVCGERAEEYYGNLATGLNGHKNCI